jgi:hypothetical protein
MRAHVCVCARACQRSGARAEAGSAVRLTVLYGRYRYAPTPNVRPEYAAELLLAARATLDQARAPTNSDQRQPLSAGRWPLDARRGRAGWGGAEGGGAGRGRWKRRTGASGSCCSRRRCSMASATFTSSRPAAPASRPCPPRIPSGRTQHAPHALPPRPPNSLGRAGPRVGAAARLRRAALPSGGRGARIPLPPAVPRGARGV